MFGCCVAGRLLQTNLHQVDDTHALFEIPAASTVNHICVFLLGTVPFPEGYGATVHFLWPGKGAQLLGMLSNEKPSAIFRLRGTFNAVNPPSAFTSGGVGMSLYPQSSSPDPNANVTAVLGFSIEPLQQIAPQVALLPAAQANSLLSSSSSPLHALPNSSSLTTINAIGSQSHLPDAPLLAERIAKHLLNYVSGFVAGGGGVTQDSVIPMNIIRKWYENFLGKVRAGGVGFLERGE